MHDTPLRLSGTPRYVLSWEEARHMESSGLMSVAAPPPATSPFSPARMGPGEPPTGTRSPASALEAAGQRFPSPERGRTRSTRSTSRSLEPARCKDAPSCTAGHSSFPIWSPPVQPSMPQEPAEALHFFQSAGNVAAWKRLVAGFSPDRLGTLESGRPAAAVCTKNWAPARKRSAGNWGILCARCAGRGEAGPRLRGRGGESRIFRILHHPHGEPTRHRRARPCTASKYATRVELLRLRLEIYSRPWLARLYGACRI